MSLQTADFFIQKIAANKPVAMFKPGCPFCSASHVLINALAEINPNANPNTNSAVISNFAIFTLDVDFTNQTLLEVSQHFGWKPDGIQQYPSKPQIFIEGELVGGNSEFYKSKWNVGQGMPQLKNPMSF